MEIIEFLIDENATMIDAMQQLDRVGKKVLFAVRDGRLVASLTDGDIRRWILRKGNLEAKVKDIANYNPKFLHEEDKEQAKDVLKKYSIEALPILDETDGIISIVLWNEKDVGTKRKLDIPVVIMAGGLGTRLYPYTKILPKPLIPIGEIPIVEHIMNRFYQYGSGKFYLIVNHKKNMIKAYFNEIERAYTVDYADEDMFLGTGGGLSLLKGKIDTTFVLSNCDILIEEDYEKIYNYHRKENNLITMVCSLKHIRIPYGVIQVGETGEIVNMEEKPELTFFTNTGMYIVEPKVIKELEEDRAVDFPDIIERYKLKGEKIGVYPICEDNWTDMGQLDGMEKLQRRFEKNE
jgi:dTDP-glucose pyrophosphorylase